MTPPTLFFPILFILCNLIASAQEFPQGYFRLPLDGDIGLSATFAEFRTGHFHAGLDIRTGGEVGKPVYSVADGYVCGVRISPWGGGKMLYVKHPNGYTSVYMHLNDYAGEIGRYVRREQYKEQAYAIVRDIPEGVLPVKKGQVIAHSGNSGSSGGPHLHFELRHNGHTINPLLFGLRYSDNIKPIIRGIRIYPTEGEAFNIAKQEEIEVAGPFYLGVYATDAAEGSTLRNGVDKVEIFVDGKLFFKYITNRFPLDSSRISNALIDYPYYVRTREAYLLTRSLPGAQGEWIPVRQGNGILRFAEGTTHSIRVRVSDIKGNLDEHTLNIKMLASIASDKPSTDERNTYPVVYNKPLKINGTELKLTFPAHTLYDNAGRMDRFIHEPEAFVVRSDPDPSHACIQGYMDRDRLSFRLRCRREFSQHILPEARGPDLKPCQVSVTVRKYVSQKKDRLDCTRLPHRSGFLKSGCRVAPHIRQLFHLLHYGDGAVAVPVSLEDRDDLYVLPDVRAHALHIIEHRVHIDLCPHSLVSGCMFSSAG